MLTPMAHGPGLALDDALARVRRAFTPLPTGESSLLDAHGRVLAVDVVARADLPAGDDAALDGVACRVADTLDATAEAPVRLRRIGEAPAGAPYARRLRAGEAVVIATGGLVPEGADGLVPVEALRIDGDHVWVHRAASPRDIRPRGQALRAGAVAVTAGTRLDAAALALAASAGHDRLSVRRAPRIAIVATGDELRPAGDPHPAHGAVFDANGPGLAALAREAGAEVVAVERVGDDLDALRARLDALAGRCDVLVTSGGVSMGGRDQVRALLEREGEVDFWRLAIKPGGPALFGRWRTTPLLGLPGNPVSSLVVFWLLGRPALAALEGDRAPAPSEAPWPAVAGRGLAGAGRRTHLARVRLVRDGHALIAEPVSTQSSGVLRSLTEADGLAVLPPDVVVQTGDPIDVIPWRLPATR